MATSDTEVRYRSTNHPGDQTAPVVFGSYLVQPIAATMTPVMIIAAVMVLQGRDPLPFVAWAAPAAIAVAAAWTWFRMRSVIVEVVVTHNGAAALTILESLLRSRRPRLQRVFDVRRNEWGIQITIGLATYVLESKKWPQMTDLIRDLESARAFYA